MFDPVKVLVVDDEEPILKTVRRALELDGFVVETTPDPAKALELVRTDEFLIVISDIMMPGINGIDLLREIKTYNGMIQVIMMTGYVTLGNVLDCLRRGANDCILKPFEDISQINRAVRDSVAKFEHWKDLLKRLENLR